MVGVVVRQHVRPHVGALIVEPIDDDAGEVFQAFDGAALRRHACGDAARARDVMWRHCALLRRGR